MPLVMVTCPIVGIHATPLAAATVTTAITAEVAAVAAQGVVAHHLSLVGQRKRAARTVNATPLRVLTGAAAPSAPMLPSARLFVTITVLSVRSPRQ